MQRAKPDFVNLSFIGVTEANFWKPLRDNDYSAAFGTRSVARPATQAAQALGITIKTLYNKLHEYGEFEKFAVHNKQI